MTVYWLLFGYFLVGAISAGSMPPVAGRRPNIFFWTGALLLIMLIGLRYEVGGDWKAYSFIYRRAGSVDLWPALSIGDPGYQALNWLVFQIGVNLWLVNVICALFFVWGLFRLARTQPEPWLAVLVAVPYMVIVIAMGYTRQAAALGILMAGIAGFIRTPSPIRFFLFVVGAALFHRTAIVAFPVVALASTQNRFVNLLLVLVSAIALYNAFLGDAMDHFVQNYIRTGYSSEGAAVRTGMNILASVAFGIFGRRLMFDELEWRVWRNFCIASVISLLALLFTPSSTAVDRISLYLIPLQVAVFCRVPLIFKSRLFGTVTIALYSFAVEFVWLNFGQFSWAWVPYHFFPLFGKS